MDHFTYRDGLLHADDVPVTDVVGAIGTPTYLYAAATLRAHAERLKAAFAPLGTEVCFAVKACPNVHVLRVLAQAGCGMDVVSAGELARALAAGVPPEKIVFAGVGKTQSEIAGALDIGGRPIAQFNVESEPELELIAATARAMNTRATCAIRVNPLVKAGAHDYISTATSASKFGVSPEHCRALFDRFSRDPHLALTGLHVHIGSAITETGPYVSAISCMLTLVDELRASGHTIDSLDLGGGFGADYETGAAPSAAEFARAITPLVAPYVAPRRGRPGLRTLIEPGRAIAANAGVLLTRVVYVKHAHGKRFIVCDAGMNALIRPSLYGSFHFIWPVRVAHQHEPARRTLAPDMPGLERADVVGPVCESGDFLAKDRLLPPVAAGDLLAVFAAGAYGMSMSSRYNSHPLPAEALADGHKWRTIRSREAIDDMLRHELDAR